MTAIGHVLARQEQFDLFDALAEAATDASGRPVEAAKLVRKKGAREADIEAAAADRVQQRS